MKVLGRELTDPFTEFWEEFSPELTVAENDIEMVSVRCSETRALTRRRLTSQDGCLCRTTTLLITWRTNSRTRSWYPESIPRRCVEWDIRPIRRRREWARDLEEMVLHPSLEAILEPFGFSHEFILNRMAEGARGGLSSAPVPEYGTPWHFTWAIRHCLLRMELPRHLWTPIETIYAERAPEATALGRELLDIMLEVGWGSREWALEAMTRTRDCLGLDVQDKVLVLDTDTGRIL